MTPARLALLLVLSAFGLSGCGRVNTQNIADANDPLCQETAPPTSGDACARLEHVPETVHFHVATCDDPTCGNAHNPPTGGPHCGTPLACNDFTTAQPRCQWVHNLEHGHVVLLYNCPCGCPDIVSALEEIRDNSPLGANGRPRVLVTPDPLLPTRVGAVVWGWSFTSNALDRDAIACLMSHQDEEAGEAGLLCQ